MCHVRNTGLAVTDGRIITLTCAVRGAHDVHCRLTTASIIEQWTFTRPFHAFSRNDSSLLRRRRRAVNFHCF